MKKQLGFVSIFCISSGAMISSGLFVLPGLAFAKAGPVVFLSYFAAGAVSLTTVLSLSELITAMPKAGGDYFYVSRTFGQLFGTVSGILSWFALSLKSAFAVIGLAELVFLALHVDLRISAVIFAAVFTAINIVGVKEAVRFQIILVAGLFVILTVFVLSGIQKIEMARYEPFLSHGFNALFSTAGFVFVSFGGVLTTASIAGEIRNPSKNIPAGLIGSITAVTLLYVLVTMVTVGIMPGDTLEQSLAPVAEAGRTAGGAPLYAAIMLASLFAFITTANGGILTAARYPIALAKDGMLPSWAGRTSRRKQTPYAAVVLTGMLIGSAVLLDLDLLVKAASAVILLSNIFAHLSVIVMRESRIANYKPTFKAPLYPWLQLLGIIVFILLIIDMGITPVFISLLFISGGVVLYFIRRKHSQAFSPAFMHLIERITDKKFGTEHLSDELREIITDRDGLGRDEFDKAVEFSSFLDIEGPVKYEDFLEKAASAVSGKISGLTKSDAISLFNQRESESSTAITDFVAVPHIIIESASSFCIFLIRSREGIIFSENNPSVKAVFMLIGSKDNRNLHLRALAAIAQVIDKPGFTKRWLAARNHTEIKDIFLLDSRERH